MYVYYTARACLQFTCITKLLFDSDSAESLPNSRKGRGKKMVSTIRSLMRDSTKWFEITNKSDYHFPGVLKPPNTKCLGYCADISTLPQYDSHNPHFLFTDIQLGKGKARNPQRVSMTVDGNEETLWYRIVPCGGVKQCPAPSCTYVVATREVRSCMQHPNEKLTRSNELSGECPVEFMYIWPVDEADKRR